MMRKSGESEDAALAPVEAEAEERGRGGGKRVRR